MTRRYLERNKECVKNFQVIDVFSEGTTREIFGVLTRRNILKHI